MIKISNDNLILIKSKIPKDFSDNVYLYPGAEPEFDCGVG